MAKLKMVGDEIRLGGKKVGSVKGDEIRDASSRKIGSVKGDEIRDASSRKIGSLKGDEIRDKAARKIGTLTDAKRAIEGGRGGVTLAALWMFFAR